MNRLANPEGLPEPVGFSHAVVTDGSRALYVAGQTGRRADGSIDDDLVGQFRQALSAVAACMDEAGFPPESLARMVIYTTDVAGYRESLGPIGTAYRELFGHHFPAMALFGVTELFEADASIEVVATAVMD